MSEFGKPEYQVNQLAWYVRSFTEKYRVTIVKVSPGTEEGGWRYTVKYIDVDKPDKEVVADSLVQVDDDNAVPPAPPPAPVRSPAKVPPQAPAPASGGIFGGGGGGAGPKVGTGNAGQPAQPSAGTAFAAGLGNGNMGLGAAGNTTATNSGGFGPTSDEIFAAIKKEADEKQEYTGEVPEMLEKFYKATNQDAEKVANLLEKYKNYEYTLLRRVARKYNREPEIFRAGTRLLLASVYNTFDPAMLARIDTRLAELKEKKDDDIITGLKDKYPQFVPADFKLALSTEIAEPQANKGGIAMQDPTVTGNAEHPTAGTGSISSCDNNEPSSGGPPVASNTEMNPASIFERVVTEENKKKSFHGTVFKQLFAFRSRHKEPGSAAEKDQITKAIKEELRNFTGSENTLLRIEAKNNDEDPSVFGAGNRLLLTHVFKEFDPEMMTEIDGIVAYMENKSDDDIIIELMKTYPSFDPAKFQLKIVDPAKAASAVSFYLNQSANKIDKAVSTANESMGMAHCLDFLQKEVPDDIRSRICKGADTLSGISRMMAPSDGSEAMSEALSYKDEKGAINNQVWRRSDDPQYCVASRKKLENTREDVFGHTGDDITEWKRKIESTPIDDLLGNLHELKKRRFHDSGPYILNLSYNGVVPQEQPIALNASFWGGSETEQRSSIALWVECMLLSQTFPVRFDANLRALYPSDNV